jgi:Mrp family chromosome partitioning ATPase
VIAGKRTLLVECDLRRPTLARRLGLAEAPGLTDYLARRADPQEILQTVEIAPSQNGGSGPLPTDGESLLVCITAGTPSPQPAEMLGSERLHEFLQAVGESYEMVVIDSSPLLAVADTRELLPHVDGVLICIRSLQTTREQALAAKAALDHFPTRPTGIVVTGLGSRDAEQYGYYGAAGRASSPSAGRI